MRLLVFNDRGCLHLRWWRSCHAGKKEQEKGNETKTDKCLGLCLLDLDVVVQDSYRHAGALGHQPERAHQHVAETKNCPGAILTRVYKVQL